MFAVQQSLIFESVAPKKTKKTRAPKSQINYELLLKKAAPSQIKEAQRLNRLYGAQDPKIAQRYLYTVITRKALPVKEKPMDNNPWDCNELLEDLPENWQQIVCDFVQNKSYITAQKILNHLVPNNNEYYETLEKSEEPVPLVDPWDKQRVLEMIDQYLEQINWHNEQIFKELKSTGFYRKYLKYTGEKLNEQARYNSLLSPKNIVDYAQQFEAIDATAIISFYQLDIEPQAIDYVIRILRFSDFLVHTKYADSRLDKYTYLFRQQYD
jgi:hypothetical protein